MLLTKFEVLLIFSAVVNNRVAGDVDSTGTNFLTVFPWNSNAVDAQPIVCMDFVNFNQNIATVDLIYYVYSITGDDITNEQKTKRLTVQPMSKTRFEFGSDSVYQYLSLGLNIDHPSTKIFIHSDIPISVFAHNYLHSGEGDTFTVLPTTMAGQEYSFSLPTYNTAKGLAMIYFLPTVADTKINFSIVTETSSQDYSSTVSAALDSNVVMFGGPPKAFSFYAKSNQPFLVVAAVRLLPASNTNKDFGSFMPIPLISQECHPTTAVDDYHLIGLVSGNTITVTPPGLDCSDLQMTAFGLETNRSEEYEVMSRKPKAFSFLKRSYGNILVLRSQSALFEVIQYGGYSISGGGAFLNNLPSLSQYVTGVTPYLSYKNDSNVMIFGDRKTSLTATTDGQSLTGWKQMTFFDHEIYYNSFTFQNDIHFFSSTGKYILYVTGPTNSYSYGFISRFARQGAEASTVSPPITSAMPSEGTTVKSSTVPLTLSSGATLTAPSARTGTSNNPSGGTTVMPTTTTTTKAGNIINISPALFLTALMFAMVLQ